MSNSILSNFHILHLLRTKKGKHFYNFSTNSEANASELVENIEEIFIRYYMSGYIFNKVSVSTLNIEHYSVTKYFFDLFMLGTK